MSKKKPTHMNAEEFNFYDTKKRFNFYDTKKSINKAITPLLTNIATSSRLFKLARTNDKAPCLNDLIQGNELCLT